MDLHRLDDRGEIDVGARVRAGLVALAVLAVLAVLLQLTD